MDIELKKSRGIKLLTQGKICKDNITITPKLKAETFTENGTYPIPEGYAGHGVITVDVKSSVSVTGVYAFNDSIVKTGAREFSSYADTGYGEYISDVNNYIVCKNDDGTFSYILPVYVLAENIFRVFRHEGEIGEEAGSDIYYENYDQESVDNRLSGLVVNINSAPSNLTEWILANATPESSGGGGGECDKPHINIVDELPEVGVDGAYYGIHGFVDVINVGDGGHGSLKDEMALMGNVVCVAMAQADFTSDMLSEENMYLIYFTDIQDVYYKMGSYFVSLSSMGGKFIDEITDLSEVDPTKLGYYVLFGATDLFQYKSGTYKKVYTQRSFYITQSYDYEDNVDIGEVQSVSNSIDNIIVIPSVSPDGHPVKSINYDAFNGDCFTEIVLPDGLKYISQRAFKNCYCLKSIKLPDSMDSVHFNVFENCISLTDVTLPARIIEIDTNAFLGCVSLGNIEIPSTLTTIRSGAFANCTSLTNITFKGTVEQWNAISLGGGWNENVPATKVICSDGEVAVEVSGGSDESGSTTPSEVITEEITIETSTEDKEYTPSDGAYFSKVTVKAIPSNYVPDGYVPEGTVPDGYVKPSGTKSITTNGNHNVAGVEFASVNVPTYVTISSIEELSSITASDGMVAVLGG